MKCFLMLLLVMFALSGCSATESDSLTVTEYIWVSIITVLVLVTLLQWGYTIVCLLDEEIEDRRMFCFMMIPIVYIVVVFVRKFKALSSRKE